MNSINEIVKPNFNHNLYLNPSRLIYKTFPGSSPSIEKGDGDGTVNIRSLLGCTGWEGKQKQKFHHHVFPKLDHLQILRDDQVAEFVKSIVQGLNSDEQETEDDYQDVLPQIDIVP